MKDKDITKKISANVYKINDNYSKSEIIATLIASPHEMTLLKEIEHDGSYFNLFIKEDERSTSGWLLSLNKLFLLDIEEQTSYLLKAVVLVTTKTRNYVALYGYSKRFVDDLIDPNFGLDFAAKAIKNYQIDAKNVDYLQKNTLRSSINFKRDRFELPQVNEAFFGIVGKPTYPFYGEKINCKEGVAFSKNFSIENGDFFKLFTELDATMKLKDEISIPRLNKIDPKRQLSYYLNKKILASVRDTHYSKIDVSFNVPYLHNLDENITDFNSTIVFRLSCKIEDGTYKRKDIESLDTIEIANYLREYPEIKNLEDINVIMFDGIHHTDHEISKRKLVKLILSEFEIGGKLYLLQNGFWGFLNQSFLDVMKEQLDIIQSNETNLIKFANDPTSSYQIYNTEYHSDSTKRKYAGENGYIETVVRQNTPRVLKLHTRLITGNGVKNEIADFYDTQLNEVFAVKMGTSSGDCIYSFEQSIVSIYLLKNKQLFQIEDNLKKYNSLTRYEFHQVFPDSIINTIKNVDKTNILWVIPASKNKKINNKILNSTFSIMDIDSFMVKLKFIEWYNVCLENGMTPKLIMVDQGATLSSLPKIPNHPYFKPHQVGKIYYT